MLILCAAGISLGASTVAWWNRRKTKKVVEQIEALQAERERILSEDRSKTLEIAAPYLQQLRTLITNERSLRQEIRPDLEAALRKVRDATEEEFGVGESSSVIRVEFELEIAVGRLNAELAYLKHSLDQLDDISESNLEIPDPSIIDMPEDFPREGGLIQLDGSEKHLHGYALHYEETSSEKPGSLFALFDVDHKRKRARACSIRGHLLSASLGYGDREIVAKVVDRTQSGLTLDYWGVQLRVRTTYMEDVHSLLPGDEIEVYPKPWTLRKLINAGRPRSNAPFLSVSSRPQVTQSDKVWGKIPVAITAEALAENRERLNNAFEIIDNPQNRRRPWKIALGEEHNEVLLTCGDVFLQFRIHDSGDYFVFEDVQTDGTNLSYESVRVFAQLNLFIPGVGDAINSESFKVFLASLMESLASEKHRIRSRKEALNLRKLSLIYQDQQSHEFRESSVPVFVIDHERKKNAWWVDFMLLTDEPSWLQQMTRYTDRTLPNVMTSTGSFGVEELRLKDSDSRTSSGTRIDTGIKTYSAKIVVERSQLNDFSPSDIRFIVNPYEGTQQRRLIRALEDTIIGEYESVEIRRRLLESKQEKKDHKLEGHEDALSTLHSHPSVFAVWGPPGTGKTTLIVRYLREFLDRWSKPERPNILISAPTHVAVDEIMMRLFEDVSQAKEESVRYGHPDKVRPEVKERLHRTLIEEYLNQSVPDTPLGNRWRDIVGERDAREAVTRWFLKYAMFHGTTLVGMPRADFALMDRSFDLAIIDEAGKAFGAEMLIPARLTNQLVVVGDHRQLPPTITEDVIDGTIDYRLDQNEVESILRRNAFRQLFESLPPTQKAMLTTQYRMDPEIANVVSDLFYDGKVETGRSANTWDITKSRLTFVDFADVREYRNEREPDGHSQFNAVEMKAALQVLNAIYKHSDPPSTTLVICPYKAQRERVDKEVQNRFPDSSINVTTVDAVQGGEAELVMLLMTRNRGSSRFLLDEHRFNVALSRSKEACIIFGDGRFLTRSEQGPMHRLLERGRRGAPLSHIRAQEVKDLEGTLSEQVLK